jgi:hypothetical protein
MKSFLVAAVAALAATSIAPAAAQAFDPRSYEDRIVGQPTQVLVLGTPHLSGAPDNFDPAVLEPLLERLAAFRPDVIAIEALPGESIDALWRYREIYPEVAASYGGRTMALAAMTRTSLGLDLADAEAEARRTLAQWPASPTPAQRRRLATLFVAAGDPHSALVQWWRLEPAERRAEDGVNQMLVEQLAAFETRRNENHLIGARLAARLGLERVHAIDDHASDDVVISRMADLEAFMSEPWLAELLNDPRFEPLRDAAQRLSTPRQALDTYRMLNSPAAGQTDADLQWLNMLRRESPNAVGRTRVAEWETRNLRQVANIREVASQHPGGRVLVIVGSAHKPWFDAYLGMMTDVEIVDAARVLR